MALYSLSCARYKQCQKWNGVQIVLSEAVFKTFADTQGVRNALGKPGKPKAERKTKAENNDWEANARSRIIVERQREQTTNKNNQ